MESNKIYNENALSGLKNLPDNSVDCCVTSPPYFKLRDYGVDGQIGLEDTPEEFITKLIAVFEEVRRVLKPQGTLWVNIGDSYAGSNRGWGDNKKGSKKQSLASYASVPNAYKGGDCKAKDLIGIPWMLAFALRANGWFLRQDIIWHKPNPMPESVTDRCTKSHEYIFLLSKSSQYYFDSTSIQEPATTVGQKTPNNGRYEGKKYTENPDAFYRTKSENAYMDRDFRNKRDVWTIPTQPIPEAHFATFPEKLVAECIKAGCPEDGIVIDPFMGSGTTAIVARKFNRKYIGFELNDTYVHLSAKRLKKELGLFI